MPENRFLSPRIPGSRLTNCSRKLSNRRDPNRIVCIAIKTDRKRRRGVPRAWNREDFGLETGEEERGTTIERGRAMMHAAGKRGDVKPSGVEEREGDSLPGGRWGEGEEGETPQRQWGSFDSRANWNAADANDDGTHRGLGYPLWPGVGGSRGVLASTGVTQG